MLTACEGSTEPGFPRLELEPFSPLAQYETWWAETEECSGLEGGFDRISFYRVSAPLEDGGTRFPCGEGGESTRCSGMWQAPHDIYLAPAMLRIEHLVKHEMLHDLIGAPGHPAAFHECSLLSPYVTADSR